MRLGPAALAAGLAAAAAAPAAARAQPGPLFLASLEVEAEPGLALQGAPLRVTLELHPEGARRLASLREWFPGAVAEDDRVTVTLPAAGYPPAAVPAAEAHRQATFLVDWDQEAVGALRAQVVGRSGEAPTPADLARFVEDHVVHKNLSRVFDAASTVAARREGDCTEHAVLLVALARLFGAPARVVQGVALISAQGRIHAFGHAWAEIHDGTGWRLADAAGLPPDQVRYLPLGALADEGPGYKSGLARVFSPLRVRRVLVAPDAPAAARAPDGG